MKIKWSKKKIIIVAVISVVVLSVLGTLVVGGYQLNKSNNRLEMSFFEFKKEKENLKKENIALKTENTKLKEAKEKLIEQIIKLEENNVIEKVSEYKDSK